MLRLDGTGILALTGSVKKQSAVQSGAAVRLDEAAPDGIAQLCQQESLNCDISLRSSSPV